MMRKDTLNFAIWMKEKGRSHIKLKSAGTSMVQITNAIEDPNAALHMVNMN